MVVRMLEDPAVGAVATLKGAAAPTDSTVTPPHAAVRRKLATLIAILKTFIGTAPLDLPA